MAKEIETYKVPLLYQPQKFKCCGHADTRRRLLTQKYHLSGYHIKLKSHWTIIFLVPNYYTNDTIDTS